MEINKFGRYEIIKELGHGGFGKVYLAHDEHLELERAIKVLHPALASDQEFIARFRREAKFASHLDHPNIVPVYEFGEDQGFYYLVMKYMPGGSLVDVLAKEKYLSLIGRLPLQAKLLQH